MCETSVEARRFSVGCDESGDRLDKFVVSVLSSGDERLSRASIQALIKEGSITLNGQVVKARQAVAEGDVIELLIPEKTSDELVAQDIPIEVLFEDDDIIVVDKQVGLVVHPAAGNLEGTLVNALLHHCNGTLSTLAGEDRPGIVHRLDKDTSGCLIAAKTDRAYESLVSQFSGRETGKKYLAVTSGVPALESGTIQNRIGRHPVNRQKMAVLDPPAGKEAITDYVVANSDPGGKWAFLECVIHTGRTHQIRVHLKESLHCPILGDPIYGRKGKGVPSSSRLMLHARELQVAHPVSGERLTFEASVPAAFAPFSGPVE